MPRAKHLSLFVAAAAVLAYPVAGQAQTPPNVLVHRAEVRTLSVPKGRAR